jgi:hypothetical protein
MRAVSQQNPTGTKPDQISRSKFDIKTNEGIPSGSRQLQESWTVTESISLTIRFDTEKKTPTIGRPSKTAAQKPKAETTPSQSG